MSTPTIVVAAPAVPSVTSTPATPTTPARPATTAPGATSAAAKKKRKATSKPKSASAAAMGKSAAVKPGAIAAVQRLGLTASGRLRVTLRCPRTSARPCGAIGTIVAGTSLGEVVEKSSLRFRLAAVTVRKGATRARSFTLTTVQLAELHELRDVNFRVRLAVPGATKRFRELFVRTRVPPTLRGTG